MNMNRRGFLGLCAAGAGVALWGSQVCGHAHAWEPGEQRVWNRKTIYVWSTLPHNWYVGTAAEAWDDSSALELITVYEQPDLASSYIKIVYGDPPSDWYGVTEVEYDGIDRIKRSLITIYDGIDEVAYGQARRMSLIRHEIGHALGFNHSTTGLDVMSAARPGGDPNVLSQFHKDRLRELYGPPA